MTYRPLAILVFALLLWAGGAATATALPVLPDPARAPVGGKVVKGFDPPEADWLPGHRGVDLAVSAGEPVRAAAAGTVSFAGMIAGRGVVAITHGAVRTTYEPLTVGVRAGQQVALGEVIGTAEAGHAGCPVQACLHWGLKEGETYLDPQLLLTAAYSEVRLLPLGTDLLVAERIKNRAPSAPGSVPTGGVLQVPVTGPVTSPFGMRVDPITGTWRLHSGTDFGAPCSAPIRAAAQGTVSLVTWHPSYGNRLVLDHDMVGETRLTTAYNHAEGYSVRPGQHVTAGQQIGKVGTTGDSTGCHLHFMVYASDQITDPMPYLTPSR